MVNGVDIYSDITGTITAYDSADYFTMGQDIGNGVKLAALGSSVGGIEEADVEEFASGFIEGIVGSFELVPNNGF